MSNPLTKYIAASALAGALAFGGFTIAGAQDSGSTTTPTTTTEQPSTAPTDQAEHCKDKAGDAGTAADSSTTPAPSTSSSTGSSNITNT
ncbi:MAG: hypothetical protein JWO77_1468 [Ilumatobacteraceae bacterium]|nr:hypothetical protein [Ilumatobacteraceae bacterium]